MWSIFTFCDRQLRVAFGGIYAFDYTPIFLIALARGIAFDGDFFRKIKIFETEALECLTKRKNCTEEDKKKCRIQYGEYLEWACKQCEEMKNG